jgi:hypothetical protein
MEDFARKMGCSATLGEIAKGLRLAVWAVATTAMSGTVNGEARIRAAMNLTLEIPDDLAKRLGAEGGDLSRRALEALVAEEYRQGRLNKPDIRRLLGFTTSDQIDTFLRAHEVWIDYTIADLERERTGLQRLGLKNVVGHRRHQPYAIPGADWAYRSTAQSV